MQIHVTLIPISNTDQPPPSPDPPEHVYHFTTGTRLRQIVNSGATKPTTAKIEAHEKPVAWFSTQGQWEPTATKVPIPGMAGRIATARAQGGLVRITVPGTCAPYVFAQLLLIAGTKPSVCIGLLVSGNWVNIPTHRRHRVAWTSPDEPTVWLAVHDGTMR